MLQKVELDEKQRGELSPLKKMNGTLAKYTEDAGDIKMFASPDGTKKYLRVWETVPPAEGKTGPAKHVKHFYLITAPAAQQVEIVADAK